MGLLDSHVTDQEFSSWKRSTFEPVERTVASLSRAKADRSEVAAVQVNVQALEQSVAGALRDAEAKTASELKAISQRTRLSLDLLQKTVSDGIPKELSALCERQIAEIEKRRKEFEAVMIKAAEHATECRRSSELIEARLSAARTATEKREAQRALAVESQITSARAAAARARASEASAASSARVLQIPPQQWETLWGRLRWVLCGSSRNS